MSPFFMVIWEVQLFSEEGKGEEELYYSLKIWLFWGICGGTKKKESVDEQQSETN